ncbi:uncharacterized protein LOC143294169 [Babylonia areolata]|uniref:uncharacterized protein LOC143294169 n=1 Tax=Babylonia areolata TaxID=304850 RepID=UPI003FD05E0B
MEELDAEATLEEFSKGIDRLTFGKAPGIDGILPDLIKHSSSAKSFRLQKLAERVTVDMVFSRRQIHEKCREQKTSLFVAFIDLTKAFDLVSRDGHFEILPKASCPPKVQSMIESYHSNMKGTVQFNGSSSEPFDIRSSVKQGCVLASTLFEIFFALLLKHAFGTAKEEICYDPDQTDRLFNLTPSEPRQRFVKPSSETCCLLTT